MRRTDGTANVPRFINNKASSLKTRGDFAYYIRKGRSIESEEQCIQEPVSVPNLQQFKGNWNNVITSVERLANGVLCLL